MSEAAAVVNGDGRVVFQNAAHEALGGAMGAAVDVTRVPLDADHTLEIRREGPGADAMRAAHARLVHQEKMLSLGRLVAGIAHELNNPINFIYGNVDFLSQYVEDLVGLVRALDESPQLTELKRAMDWDYVVADLRKLINSIRSGAERTATIVRDLKTFSHAGAPELKETDVISSLEITLNLISPLHKNRIDIVRDFEPNLPKIVCNAGHIAQVFMNILTNAAQAIRKRGTIWITLRTSEDRARVCAVIRDDGAGISPDDMAKITDPFFTTKEVGEGTGLGLWITANIVRAHGGTLSWQSALGQGSTFTVELPVAGPAKSADSSSHSGL